MRDTAAMDELRGRHPRPQLTRPDWTDLSGPWGFAYDDGDVGLDERWSERDDVFDRVITVPFPPESPASGIGDRDFHPVVWYRRTVRRRPRRRAMRLLLHFGAVDYRASVWVNGRLVAEHEGGHTPFSADVTAVLVARRGERAHRTRGGPAGRPDPAAGQAGLAGATAQHLVRAHHRHLAAGLAGSRCPPPTSPPCAGPPTCSAARCGSGWSSTGRSRRGCSCGVRAQPARASR